MDLRMPDGTLITGVPDNANKADVIKRYQAYNAPQIADNGKTPEPFSDEGPIGLPALGQARMQEDTLSPLQELLNIGKRGASQINETIAGAGYNLGAYDPASYAERMRINQKEYQAAAPSQGIQEGMARLQQANSTGNFTDVLAEMAHPQNYPAVASLVAESAISSAPIIPMSVIGGVLRGPVGNAVATGMGSFGMEFGSAVGDLLDKKNIDSSDPVAVRRALDDPKFLEEARDRAIKRGIPVATLDALSAGFAGRFINSFERALAKNAIKGTVTKAATIAAAKEAGLQVGAGMAGEKIAQAVTGENKPLDVIMEGLAELPGGIGEVATNVRTARAQDKLRSILTPTEPAISPISEQGPAEPPIPPAPPAPPIPPIPTPVPSSPAPILPPAAAEEDENAPSQDMNAMLEEMGLAPIKPQQVESKVKEPKVEEPPKKEEIKVVEPSGSQAPKVEATQQVEPEKTPTVNLHGREIPITLSKVDKNAGDQLVEVNTKPFEERFKKDETMYVGPHGTANAIEGRYPRFEEFSKTAPSIEAPNVAVNENGSVIFGNGRHRYAYMRDQGISKIPMAMDSESIANAKKFGYIGEIKAAGPKIPLKTTPSHLSPEFQAAYENHLKSADAANKAGSMVKTGAAIQAQAQPFIDRAEKARADMYEALFKERDNLSPDNKETIDLAQRAINANQRGFAEGMLSNIIKNITPTPQEMDFRRSRTAEFEAQAKPKENVTVKETHNLDTLFENQLLDKKRLDNLGKFDDRTKESIAKTNEYLQKLTDAINAKGFKVFEDHMSMPQDVKNLKNAFTNLHAGASRVLLDTQHVAGKQARKSKKSHGEQNVEIQTAQKKLNKSHIEQNKDIEKARDLLGEIKRKEPKSKIKREELQGTPAPLPEEISNAEETIKLNKRDINKAKLASYSLWTALKGVLTAGNVSDLGDGYSLLKAGKGKEGTDISSLVHSGALDPFLPFNMRRESETYDELDSVEEIKNRLLAKNYLTYEAEMEIEQLMGSTQDAEAQIREYLTLKEVNELIDQAADEQREADLNARTLESEREDGITGAGETELALTGQTPDEIRAAERAKEDRLKADKEAEAKAKADEGVDDFALTGSNRPADLAAARGQESLFGGPTETIKPKETSEAYDKALEESRQASREFMKQQEAYRARTINDEEFLKSRKEYDIAMTKFDKAFAAESKGIPLDNPNIIDGTDLIREIGKEKQLLLIADESNKLTANETAALEKEYGSKSGTDEFLQRLHDDVINFITNGASSVKNKIRGIINKIANSLLSVAVAFNMNYVSIPVNVVVPAYETKTQEVIQEAPEEAAKDMSPQARRAYEVLYPSLKNELIKENKLFLVTDKPTAMQFIFNPDGSLLMKSKVLLAKGMGDFEKGNNNIDANKITPAGVRTLVKRFHTSSTEGYDFDTVFGAMGVDEKTGGRYFSTVYHSVYTHLPDAQKRLQALQQPGAANSRYSFGCINVDKVTFGKLVKEHGEQMDGATLFVVPDNDQNVMEFINGKAISATDITRRKVEPTIQKVQVPVSGAKAVEGEKIAAREEKYFNIFKFEPEFEEEKKRNPSFKRTVTGLNKARNQGKITDEEFAKRISSELDADNNRKSNKPAKSRERGQDIIIEKLRAAKRRGEISGDAVELAEWFMRQNPSLVDDLGISIKQGKPGVGGHYVKFIRIMTLMKGAGNDETPVHEMLHHTERMMPDDIQNAIRKEWLQQLLKAQKNAKTPEEKVFFAAVMDSHFGDNRALNIEIKDKKGNVNTSVNKFLYDMIMRAKEQGQSLSSSDLAKFLLQYSDLPIENYRFFNPSEFWAVNGSRIVAGDYAAVQGGTLTKLKNWLGKLAEKLKSLFGLRSDAPVIKALESLSKSDGVFKTKDMLGGREYQSIYNYKGQPAPAATFDSPDDTKLDKFLRAIQDKHIDTKRLIQTIRATGSQVMNDFNAYLKEELYHGRTASRINDFLRFELLPLVKEMGKYKIDLAELDKYLHFRHAQERNAEIAKINPSLPDAGSGLKNAEVNTYFRTISPNRKKQLDLIASKVDAIIKGTQQVLVDGGLEEQSTIDIWNKIYAHYVPLQRSEEELDFVNHGSGLGQGYGTKGKFSRPAYGSLKTVVDVFSNVALQRERAIIRSEKARVGKALYGLALQNPNPKFWLAVNPDAIKNKKKLYAELIALGLTPAEAANIIQEPRVATKDPVTGLVRYQVNPALRNSPNVFPVRINGKDRYIFFNSKDERANNIVKAMKNLDTEQLNTVFGVVGDFTRWIAAVNTQYNPVFGAWNFARDAGGAVFNLSTTPIANKKSKVIAGIFPAMFAIYGDLRAGRAGAKVVSPLAAWNDRFMKAGGATGYSEQFSRGRSKINGERLETVVERELSKLNRGNVRQTTQAVFDWLSDYNDAMENAVRLSAFKVAVESGMTDDDAASLAKNLTVNFNRKGSSSPTWQALFAFFNASVQGTARLAETLSGPSGKKIMAGGIALGVFQALALALAGYDDDEPPQYLKDKNLIIPGPGGNYAIIPMPLGLNVIPGMGRIATEYFLGKMGLITGAKGAGSKAIDMLGLLVDTFNPLGGGTLAQVITPTIADPIIAIATNKDAFGRPISKQDLSNRPSPGYTRSRENANVIAQGLSQFLNYASGGTKDVKGAISPTADQISYLAGQYTGGVGREITKAIDTGKALLTGEDLPSYKIPIVGKLYGETSSPSAVQDKFYKNIVIMSEHEDTIKGMAKRHENSKEYRADNPEAKLWQAANVVENQVSALNKQRKLLIERGAPQAVIDRNRETKTRIMNNFNEKVKLLQIPAQTANQ